MTKDDIIRMAREAGVYSPFLGEDEDLQRFAALVAAAERDDILRMSYSQWFKSQSAYDEAIKARSNT